MDKFESTEKILGHCGTYLSGDKRSYCDRHPNDITFFNGNLYTESCEKLWFGDINVTKDMPKLQKLANVFNETLYVTAEQPFRFENVTLKLLKEHLVGFYGAKPKVIKIDPN